MKTPSVKIFHLCSVATVFAFSTLSIHTSASDFFELKNFDLLRPKVIYGEDNRVDLYEVQNPTFKFLAQSTAALFQSNQVVVNAGVAKLKTSLYGEAMSLCESEPFYEQPTGAFCSGSLVGPDLFMTAGHCISSQTECEDISFVFGFSMDKAEAYPNEVNADNVYGCKELVATFREDDGADYAIVRLNRIVNNHAPLEINRKGNIQTGTPVTVIGHPSGLPTKISDGANVRKLDNNYFQANLDTYGGNSGSAVFNSTTGLIEGILVRGENDYVFEDGCRVSNRCADGECRGEDITNIQTLAKLIPQAALL